jgi:hypothetical protein
VGYAAIYGLSVWDTLGGWFGSFMLEWECAVGWITQLVSTWQVKMGWPARHRLAKD